MGVVKIRKSNFELLRFICMISIILHHFVCFHNVKEVINFDGSSIVYYLFCSGGKLGVVLFAMITGYFMIECKASIKKLFLLEGQVLSYSIVIFLIVFCLGNINITANDIVKSFFPNILGTYWFFSSYFILYLIIPYLNKLISVISKKDFFKLLIIGFVFLVLIPTLVIYKKEISGTLYLIYYYLIGGYIRKYCKNNNSSNRYLVDFFFSYFFMLVITFILGKLSLINSILDGYILFFEHLGSIFIFGCAVSLFLWFKNLNIGQSKIINTLGSVSFGVYLFHENFFIRNLLWNKLFVSSRYYGSFMFFIYGIFISISIYFLGGSIEFIRKKIMDDKIFPIIWNKLSKNKIIKNMKFKLENYNDTF